MLHAVIVWSAAARRVLRVGGGGAPIKIFGGGGVSFLPASAAWRGVDSTQYVCLLIPSVRPKILTNASITETRWRTNVHVTAVLDAECKPAFFVGLNIVIKGHTWHVEIESRFCTTLTSNYHRLTVLQNM